MRSLLALSALAGSAYSASFGIGMSFGDDDYYDDAETMNIYEDSNAVAIPESFNVMNDAPNAAGNCECKCNCKFEPANPCNLDFIIVLDAASCVRNVWNEMKLRISTVANRLDNVYPLGGQSRFSIITYANSAKVEIGLEENLNFIEFSKRLDQVNTINEGSFLDRGLKELYSYSAQQRVADRKQVVIVVTNGKSHPDATVDRDTLRDYAVTLNDQLPGDMEAFYINTIVSVDLGGYSVEQFNGQIVRGSGNTFARVDSNNKDKYDCPGCGWNEKLFLDIQGRIVGRDGPLSLDNIISKTDLLHRMTALVENICPAAQAREVCTDCECNCYTEVGPAGKPGRPGPVGPPGIDGECGEDGVPGWDAEVGVPGPCGSDGIDGLHGHPGHHGKPGTEGDCGNVGKPGPRGGPGQPGPDGNGEGSQGSDGPDGEPGTPGAAGNPGSPGQDGQPGGRGAPGPSGSPGSPGSAGLPGYCGKIGRPGQPGEPGYRGADGAAGAPGDMGSDGQPGAPGAAGHYGAAGQPGDNGSNGEDGPEGERGVRGMPGRSGGRGGSKSTANLGSFVNDKVEELLAKYLVYLERSRGRTNPNFCQCQRYEEYARVFGVRVYGA